MHHTKFTVDGTYGDTSPYMSHTGFFKSGCTLVLESPFASLDSGELKHPISQLSHPDPSPGPSGHLCSF